MTQAKSVLESSVDQAVRSVHEGRFPSRGGALLIRINATAGVGRRPITDLIESANARGLSRLY